MTKQELIDLIGDAMWPHDNWRVFSDNVETATRIAQTLTEKLKLEIEN